MTTVHGTKETALKSLPKGWKKLEGAMTAPLGYYWASNGKSRFSGEFEQALIRDKAYWDSEGKHSKFCRNNIEIWSFTKKYTITEIRAMAPIWDDTHVRLIRLVPKNTSLMEVFVTRHTMKKGELDHISNIESFNDVWDKHKSNTAPSNVISSDNSYLFKWLGNSGYIRNADSDYVVVTGTKKTPAKKAPAKKTTGKPSVKTVKKLVSQGKVKAGFVSRLGVRKQTPPPPKSKKADEARRAMLAGYRVSKSGKLYYETRENRTDKPHEKPRRGRKAPAKRGRK